MSDQQIGTVVIGGSQSGLAVGYYLKQHGLPFVILDENDRIGDAWRKRWLGITRHGYPARTPGRNLPGQEVFWITWSRPSCGLWRRG
jgi:putative flavoprotein involved in K+ transport